MSTHHDGGLSVFIAHQVWTGIPPKVRKLASHIILYPQRIAKDSVGHIARARLHLETNSRMHARTEQMASDQGLWPPEEAR